jgi:hypothetical protein
LLTEATEHEQWSHRYKDLASLQLERALEESKAAEVQLELAEDYVCAIMHAIGRSGFAIENLDSHASATAVAAVVKKGKSRFQKFSTKIII